MKTRLTRRGRAALWVIAQVACVATVILGIACFLHHAEQAFGGEARFAVSTTAIDAGCIFIPLVILHVLNRGNAVSQLALRFGKVAISAVVVICGATAIARGQLVLPKFGSLFSPNSSMAPQLVATSNEQKQPTIPAAVQPQPPSSPPTRVAVVQPPAPPPPWVPSSYQPRVNSVSNVATLPLPGFSFPHGSSTCAPTDGRIQPTAKGSLNPPPRSQKQKGGDNPGGDGAKSADRSAKSAPSKPKPVRPKKK